VKNKNIISKYRRDEEDEEEEEEERECGATRHEIRRGNKIY
jgi:hypothetical protein